MSPLTLWVNRNADSISHKLFFLCILCVMWLNSSAVFRFKVAHEIEFSDKAAELVGSNLKDITGATYDPVSKQMIFLGLAHGNARAFKYNLYRIMSHQDFKKWIIESKISGFGLNKDPLFLQRINCDFDGTLVMNSALTFNF